MTTLPISRNVWFHVAAISGFLTVAAGAFGAHGLKQRMQLPPVRLEYFETAVRYQMFHTAAIALAALLMSQGSTGGLRAAAWSFLVGIILFCGSLYLLTLTGATWWGAVTPLGGLAFLIGWACLVYWSFVRRT